MDKERIKKLSDDIKRKLEGHNIFGEAIDFGNQDCVVVAAYHMGRFEILEENLRRAQFSKV
jgi:hypothetical protein